MFPIHNTFPREMSVIGRLLVHYGELELDLMNWVQVARSFDLNATLKVMFRVRGESNRIDIADGLGRTVYVAVRSAMCPSRNWQRSQPKSAISRL